MTGGRVCSKIWHAAKEEIEQLFYTTANRVWLPVKHISLGSGKQKEIERMDASIYV